MKSKMRCTAGLTRPRTNEKYDDSVNREGQRVPANGSSDAKSSGNGSRRCPEVHKILWVNGPPGYGKTILCAKVVQQFSTGSNNPVAYFFFSSDLEAGRNLSL